MPAPKRICMVSWAAFSRCNFKWYLFINKRNLSHNVKHVCSVQRILKCEFSSRTFTYVSYKPKPSSSVASQYCPVRNLSNITKCWNRNQTSLLRDTPQNCAHSSLWFAEFATDSGGNCENVSPSLLTLNPHDFSEFLRSKGINRCFAVLNDDGNAVVSHPELQEFADWMNDPSNTFYKEHEAVFMQLGLRTGCLMGAFLWKVNRGQAFGGIRMSAYQNLETYLKDGLRLSTRLGVKSALSGLWVGGGKGIIPEPKDKQHIQPDFRQKLFYDYGDFVSSLNGCYIAGTDIGVNTYDLYNVHSRTRWSVCGPEDIGGSGNAAALLSTGVLCAMEAALDFLKMGNLSRKTVAVQGSGGIGFRVVSGLLERGAAEVYVTDTSQKRVDDIYDLLMPKARGQLKVDKVPIGDNSILSHKCDILSPCANGHVLNAKTIPQINAKIICGAANALLHDERDCHLLNEQGITYVLEYIPNRMALVNSVYENYGRLYSDPGIERHFDKMWEHSIYVLTKRVLQSAQEQKITVVEAANEMAEKYSQEPHPLWPGRTKAIIQSLIRGEWHYGNDFWRKRRNFAKSEGCA